MNNYEVGTELELEQMNLEYTKWVCDNFVAMHETLNLDGGKKIMELLEQEANNNDTAQSVENANFLLGKQYMYNLLKKLTIMDNYLKLQKRLDNLEKIIRAKKTMKKELSL